MLFIRLFTPIVLFSVTEDKMPCYIGEAKIQSTVAGREIRELFSLAFHNGVWLFFKNYSFFDHLMINLQQSNG